MWEYYEKSMSGVRLKTLKVTSIQRIGSGFTVDAGTVVTLTGYYYYINSSGYLVYQIAEYPAYGVTINSATATEDFVKIGDYQVSASDAQRIINAMIESNKYILENNLLCARMKHHLTNSELKQLQQLQRNLEERNAALKNNHLLTNEKTGIPDGYALWQSKLDEVMSLHIAGIGSVTVTLIIVAIVVTALSTAAYFAYQYYYEQSKDDVKFSKDLTAKLKAKLTDEEYKQLEKETAGLITKAVINEKLGGFGSTIKIVLAIAAGIVALPLLNKGIQKISEK